MTDTAVRPLLLCADDYAMDEGISDAILDLLTRDRLSITSCMTQSPLWPRYGAALTSAGLAHRAGLHFNLTHPFAGVEHLPLWRLLLQGVLPTLPRLRLRESLERQLDAFEAVTGTPPCHVDGHHHVHAFGGISEIVVTTLARRYGSNRPLLRAASPLIGADQAGLKSRVYSWTTRHQGAQARAAGQPLTQAFGGMYDFSTGADYRSRFRHWLSIAPAHCELMCHPTRKTMAGDTISAARLAEHAYFDGDDFSADLAQNHCTLIIPSATVRPPDTTRQVP